MVRHHKIWLKIILVAITADFVAIIATVFIPPLGVLVFGDFSPYAAIFELIVFVSAGLALAVLTVANKVSGKLRKYLLLAGVSAVGFAVFAVMHNLVSVFFNYLFGTSVDESFFFVLATVVCPMAFIVGAVGAAARLFHSTD